MKWPAAGFLVCLFLSLMAYTHHLSSKPKTSAPDAPSIDTAPTASTDAHARKFTHGAECAECHQEIYSEWQRDQHSTAWTEEKFVRFTENLTRIECLSCHAPQPMLQTGMKQEPVLRETRREEGVSCLTCHIKEGRTVGTLGSNAVCGGTQEKRLATSEACYHCHSTHNLYKEYLASPQFKQGVSCQDCHMQQVERAVAKGGPVRKTRSHLFHGGGHDIDAIRKSLDLKVHAENGQAVITVSNVGAAHGVPGEINNRIIVLEVSLLAPNPETGDEEELNAYRESFRAPRRFMRDKVPTTQIMPGEPRVLKYTLPAAHGRVEAALKFKLEFDEPDTTFQDLKSAQADY
jgi:nitrate/TMAO reductase-like tetraheme cytochrome c subunit